VFYRNIIIANIFIPPVPLVVLPQGKFSPVLEIFVPHGTEETFRDKYIRDGKMTLLYNRVFYHREYNYCKIFNPQFFSALRYMFILNLVNFPWTSPKGPFGTECGKTVFVLDLVN
jgi:hypothetical protein